MGKPPEPSLNGLFLAVLRTVRGWSQKELAVAAGIRPAVVSSYERGRQLLPDPLLNELVGVMGFPPSLLDRARALVQAAEQARDAGARPADPLAPVRRRIEEVVSAVADEAADFTRGLIHRVLRDLRVMEDRRRAAEVWERLRSLPPGRQREWIEKNEVSWALCERLCGESEKAAADSADRAARIAELALLIAGKVSESGPWRSRLQGYAWAHVANARRVRGDLRGADEAFREADRLWEEGASGDPGLLRETRLLDLKASLRKDQRRLEEALTLLDRALAAQPEEDSIGRLLMKKANVLEKLGESEKAIEILREAAPRINQGGEPRLRAVLWFNLVVNLCHEQRYDEAESVLRSEGDVIVKGLGGDLDHLRFQWLKARIAVGRGRFGDAEAILDGVRAGFAARGIAYDTALASLELAVLLFQQQRSDEIRPFIRQAMTIFQGQAVEREGLATFHLFYQAVERNEATIELAKKTLDHLRRLGQGSRKALG